MDHVGEVPSVRPYDRWLEANMCGCPTTLAELASERGGTLPGVHDDIARKIVADMGHVPVWRIRSMSLPTLTQRMQEAGVVYPSWVAESLQVGLSGRIPVTG